MIGTVIGTYRLAEKLGDGGLGAVYRAVDQASGREAAFRIFTHDVSHDPMLADRLRAMSPALKRLQHPSLGAFYELVTIGEDLALFLEYVPGSTLDTVRQQTGQVPMNVAVSCAVQALRALEFAHGVGVLHHALRPTNLKVTDQGAVKVMDFGIGHAFGANRKTREDRLLTVLAYLAPEQIQNQPGDARSDIYSVGVVLYELLTGRLPFDHKTEFALRQAHLNEPPAPPRAYVPGLPEWLDQAVMRALAKNPASRYQNATECRAVLEAALGLSTSREAEVVRRGGAAATAIFAAAPPIPTPPAAALPAESQASPKVGAGAAAHTDAGETVRLETPAPPPQTPAPPPAAPQSDKTMAVTPARGDDQITVPIDAPDPQSLMPRAAPLVLPDDASPFSQVPADATAVAVPPVASASAAAVSPAAPGAGGPGQAKGKKGGPAAGSATSASAGKAPPKRAMGAVVAGLILLCLAAGGGGAYLWLQKQQPAEPTDQTPVTEPAVPLPPADASPGAPASGAAPAAAQATPPVDGGAAGATMVPAPPVSTVPPPTQAPSPAPPATTAAAPVTKRVPPRKPAASAPSPVVIAPGPVDAKPVAQPAPPPSPPPAPVVPAVNLPDVSFRKVKLLTQDGTSERATDVVLMFIADRLSVTPATGGATLRNVRYTEMASASYAREQKKRLGFIKSSQHLLTVETAAGPLLLRLDKDNFGAILNTLEARWGRVVSR